MHAVVHYSMHTPPPSLPPRLASPRLLPPSRQQVRLTLPPSLSSFLSPQQQQKKSHIAPAESCRAERQLGGEVNLVAEEKAPQTTPVSGTRLVIEMIVGLFTCLSLL